MRKTGGLPANEIVLTVLSTLLVRWSKSTGVGKVDYYLDGSGSEDRIFLIDVTGDGVKDGYQIVSPR